MSQVFHDIEKKIIRVLKEKPKISPEKLEEETGLSTDQIRRGIEWLKLKEVGKRLFVGSEKMQLR